MSRELITKCSKCDKIIPIGEQHYSIKKALVIVKKCVVHVISEKVVEELCRECGIDYGEPETQWGNRKNSKR